MREKKRPREIKGKPLVKLPRPHNLVKLKEEWIKPGEVKPVIYIGEALPASKVMKFLNKSGVTGPQRQDLKAGEVVTVRFGEGIRHLQLVNPESKSGTFEYGQDGQLVEVVWTRP